MLPQPRRRSVDSDSSQKDNERGMPSPNTPSSMVHGSGSPSIPRFPSAAPHFPSSPGSSAIAQFPAPDHPPAMPMPHSPHSYGTDQKSFSETKTDQKRPMLPDSELGVPPPYTPGPTQIAPPSGFRIALTTTGAFPDSQTLGQPPCYDADGSPIYIGSALLGKSVHPCKIGKHLQPCVAVPFGGKEYPHHGRYDLLPYRPDQMEFVPTSNGRIPHGRKPIGGGYEDHGAQLYHAVALINGVRVPGKTGEHLGACNVSFGGAEHVIRGNYEILCWR